eukprot:g14088.t1
MQVDGGSTSSTRPLDPPPPPANPAWAQNAAWGNMQPLAEVEEFIRLHSLGPRAEQELRSLPLETQLGLTRKRYTPDIRSMDGMIIRLSRRAASDFLSSLQLAKLIDLKPKGKELALSADERPARSGRTGQRPFGSLGDKIEVDRYAELLRKKVSDVKEQLKSVVAASEQAKIFSSERTQSQHRAGPLAIQRPTAARRSEGIFLEFSCWDPEAKDHSLIDPVEVPIYSLAISAALEAMRRMPIVLDGDVSDTGQPIALFKHVRT